MADRRLWRDFEDSSGQLHPALSGTTLGLRKMYSVYILKSLKDNSFYVGQINDLEDRLRRHNAGQSKCTRFHLPYVIVHSEEFSTRTAAVRRERQIKSYRNGTEFQNLVKSCNI